MFPNRAMVSSLSTRIATEPVKAVSPFAPDRASVVLTLLESAVIVRSFVFDVALLALANEAPFSMDATVRISTTLRANETPNPRLLPSICSLGIAMTLLAVSELANIVTLEAFALTTPVVPINAR